MNLEQLVPPLELCRAIPKGEFKDTYFSYSWCSFRNEYIICKTEWKHPKLSFPAPTLQEILADLKGFEMFGNIRYSIIKDDLIMNGRNMVECALELWLENKGIKTNETSSNR